MPEMTMPTGYPCWDDLKPLIATNAAVRSFAVLERNGTLTREQALIVCVLYFADLNARLQKEALEALQRMGPSLINDRSGPFG